MPVEQQGSDAFFLQSWGTMRTALRRGASRMAWGDPALADEWLSDAAFKALRLLRRLPPATCHSPGVLWLSLNQACADGLRVLQREQALFEHEGDAYDLHPDKSPGPEGLLAQKEALEQVFAFIGQASDKDRRLFSLAFLEERPQPEIAALLGINPAALRKRIERLRTNIRQHAATLSQNPG
jgi:RNA polymerase sigma factor (sigma-70 family)